MTKTENTRRYRVDGMDCASCATKIDTAVRKLPGIEDVRVSATAGTMTVATTSAESFAGVEKTVRQLGYKLFPRDGADRAESQSASADPSCHCDHDHEAHHHDHAHHHHEDDKAEAIGLHGHDHDEEDDPWWKSRKARLALLSGLALVLAYAVGLIYPDVAPYAFAIAMLAGLVPIARRALAAMLAGIPFTIETLMTIAAIGAVLIDAGEEAAVVVFLFLVGELLEGIAAGRARTSIRALTDLVPRTAQLEDKGQLREVAAETLALGSIILVRPGERIAADGEIVAGESSINEAPVTGESTPVRKTAGESVFAGTVNGDAALRVRVTATAADNTIARVIRLVEEAQEAKSPTERFIDRFSRYYTPGVLLAGLLVAVLPPLLFGLAWSEWIYKGLAVLLIGCPCALVISTPAAIAAALSAGARRGLLLKGGAVLEQLRHIDTIAFDKTGTLTEGKPTVTDIIPVSASETDILVRAAALEAGSSHPLALAILARAAQSGLVPPIATDARALGGKGVEATVNGERLFLGSPRAAAERTALPPQIAQTIEDLHGAGKTVSVLLIDGTLAGAIAMRDEPRADAAAGLRTLKQAGIRLVMLTGDNRRTAEAIGASLGMDEIRSELLPEDKQRIVSELKSAGRRVAKVGDGINDAPALAAADVGIAMGGGTDVALETADAAILHGRIGDISRMITLSKRTMGNIVENITIALGLKAVFLVTTILGVTGLWPAILADTGATVLVTINALRLLSNRWMDREK
ncbi:heavy metal translocating P-type ATPase [Rhizobium alvei]|uniref:P-type Zn(2+) transporter n=1 Tax=Rhizobium alvei TaxID=1132659 RepID=A0ABT8YIG6_9HYPH|nr:heavy metal translocating P-type ATPase [Rhizobium alvei]MDO6963113.1 heavy metal translocating P-type ATPase [Rhizobium alvei]